MRSPIEASSFSLISWLVWKQGNSSPSALFKPAVKSVIGWRYVAQKKLVAGDDLRNMVPPVIFGITVVTKMTEFFPSPELKRPLNMAATSSYKDG